MLFSIKVERYKGDLMSVVSRSSASPATDKTLLRDLNYEILVGTHIPNQDWHRLGALVVLLFNDHRVVDVEIWQNDFGVWIADSVVASGRGHRLRRGEGATPVEAFIELIYDIQRY